MGVDSGFVERVCNSCVRVFVSVDKKEEEEEEEEKTGSISTVLLSLLMEQALTSALLNGPFSGTSPLVKDAPQASTCWILRK